MTKVELKYDAFNIKSILTIDEDTATLRCFGTGNEICLLEWIGSFFPELVKKCNFDSGSECTVQFFGTKSDYELVKRAFDEWNTHNEGVKILLQEVIRYPQSLSEISEYANTKYTEYKTEINAKKLNLEKVMVELADNEKFDALESVFSKGYEVLENTYNEAFVKIKNDILKIKQEAVLIPVEKEMPLMSDRLNFILSNLPDKSLLKELISSNRDCNKFNSEFVNSLFDYFCENDLGFATMGRWSDDNGKIPNYNILFKCFEKEFKKISILILDYLNTAFDNICDIFNNNIFEYLSGSTVKIDGLQVPKYVHKNQFFINDKDNKPWNGLTKKISNTKGMNAVGMSNHREKTIITIQKIFDESQSYIYTIIDDVEHYCCESLQQIKNSYENEFKTFVASYMETIAKQKNAVCLEDKLSLEKEIWQLESKNELISELLSEIAGMQGENNE